jgi:hypothetical protein
MSDIRNAFNYLVVHLERRTALGKYRCEWGDTIKTDLTGRGREGVKPIYLAQYRIQYTALLYTEMSPPVP